MRKGRFLAFALAEVLLFFVACAPRAVSPEVTATPGWTSIPEPTEEPFAEQWITLVADADETLLADLDGDGVKDTVRVVSGAGRYTVSIESAGRETASIQVPCEYVHSVVAVDAVPGDGFREVLICADIGSDDYETVCFRYDGTLYASEPVAGVPLSVRDGALNVSDRTDLLGTRFVEKQYSFVGDTVPALRLIEGFLWPYDGEHTLVPVRDLPVELIMDETYLATTLSAGTVFTLTETDGESVVYFLLEDGTSGRILVMQEDAGLFLINGLPEADYFEELPYAD